MKKIKKLLAMIMAMTMVLGMAMTVSAAVAAVDVTITELDEDVATVKYVQVIEPDQTAPTGWKFTTAGAAFKNALSPIDDAQDVIWGLLQYKTPGLVIPPSANANPVSVSASALEAAFEAVDVSGMSDATINNDSLTATFSATSAGVYAIKATTTGNYSYSPMGAYVAFEYGNDGSLGLDDNVTVAAKKAQTKVDKSADETDGVVAVDKKVTYTISTTVPYIPKSVTDVKYTITDTIHGAEYLLNENDKLLVSVSLEGSASEPREVVVSQAAPDEAGHTVNQTFTIDLSDIAGNRNNANKTLTLTYQAVVKELTVSNEAKPNDGKHEYDDSVVTLYTGAVTMTKIDSLDESKKLGGAGFKVYYTVTGEDDVTTTYWAVATQKEVDDQPVPGEYYVTGWTTIEANATEISTEDVNGTVKLSGLDDSISYFFKETTAPEGYSINTNDESVTWNPSSPKEDKVGTATMADTRLAALPSTGGIGTTIFTIGGCAIMIAAAALYFVNRRKSEEN